mmetsp:Transcript_760/g.1015  ORF Transcript_760/g.1015 Transcript_760/m.1015 type:complete len:128 (-) Transcript_760:1654-2037(-)
MLGVTMKISWPLCLFIILWPITNACKFKNTDKNHLMLELSDCEGVADLPLGMRSDGVGVPMGDAGEGGPDVAPAQTVSFFKGPSASSQITSSEKSAGTNESGLCEQRAETQFRRHPLSAVLTCLPYR